MNSQSRSFCALLLYSGGAFVPAVAQSPAPTPSTVVQVDLQTEASPEQRAGWLMQLDLVAVGRFSIDYDSKELRGAFFKRPPTTLVVRFKTTRVFKSAANAGSSEALIELSSDMIEVPGAGLSAGAMREQLWSDIAQRRSEIKRQRQELDDLVSDGRMTTQERASRKRDIDLASEQLAMESKGLSSVLQPIAVGAKTFFDLGGVVKSDQDYLVALRRTNNRETAMAHRDTVYALPSWSGGSIYWSRQRDELIAALGEKK
jgi:hypothetical protein